MHPSRDPRTVPDLTQNQRIDRHMDRLDCQGISRRDFLSIASAGLAATAAAGAMGRPSVAVADPSGKLAYLAWTTRVEYMVQAGKAIEAATKALGLTYPAGRAVRHAASVQPVRAATRRRNADHYRARLRRIGVAARGANSGGE
jgi:hypothetical protein